MKKSCLFGLTACLALCALPALADTFDFSGPYAGAQLGFSSLDNTISVGAVSFDQGAIGVAGGAVAGYGLELDGGWYVGGEFGFGGEIGIATGKMHARGPVGVEQLTSFKYRVHGEGQTRP